MDKLIVYVDDADYALHLLQPMLGEAGRSPTQWVLVGCAPRVTHHVSKWVTNSARESWRGKWAEKTFSRLKPLLTQDGDEVVTHMGSNKLIEQTAQLMKEYSHARVLDARRPKFGQDLAPVTPAQAQEQQKMVGMMAAVAGAGLLVATD